MKIRKFNEADEKLVKVEVEVTLNIPLSQLPGFGQEYATDEDIPDDSHFNAIIDKWIEDNGLINSYTEGYEIDDWEILPEPPSPREDFKSDLGRY